MKNLGLRKKILLFLGIVAVQIALLSQIAFGFDRNMIGSMISAVDKETLLLNYIALELEAMSNPGFGIEISINPDGSVTGINADGSRTTAGGSWPVNEITNMFPYPEITRHLVYNEGYNSFTAVWNTTSNGYKDYVNSIENSGFGIYSQEIEAYIDGYEVHSYSAIDACGIIVDLNFWDDTADMSVRVADFGLSCLPF